jgi:tetratricopeptide (TPR) repeat protein
LCIAVLRSHHEKTVSLDRASLAALYLKSARVSGQANAYFLAEQSAERSLAALPVLNSGALLVLAEVALAKHDFSKTQVYLGQLKAFTPHSAAVLSLETTLALALGDLPRAKKSLEPLTQGVPSTGHLMLLGLLHEAQGLDAKADYLAALQLEEADDPFGSARVRTFLARWYLQHGQLQLAQDLLLEAQRIVPNDAQILVLLGETFLQLGNLDAAERIFKDLEQGNQLNLTVFNHAALRGLARVARLRGQDTPLLWQHAKDSLQSELKNGAFGHARDLAGLLLESGLTSDLPKALALAQSESLLRSDAQTLHVLAWAQLKSGLFWQARLTMQRGLRFGIQDAVMSYRMGQIELALGNSKIAQKWFAKAKIINPKLDSLLNLVGLEK